MSSGLASLTSPFVHNVGCVFIRTEEERRMLEEARCPIFPEVVTLGIVEHEGRPVQKHGIVVTPLCLVGHLRTVALVVCPIEDLIVVGNEANLLGPVVDFDRPVCVRLVTCVSGKACAHSKDAAVGDTVLVVVTVSIFRVDLPLQATTTRSLIPASDDVIESVDGDVKVGGGSLLWFWELILKRRHNGERPKRLIVVSCLTSPVVQDKVVCGSIVGRQSLLQRIDMAVVASKHAVFDDAAPRSSPLPPVMWLRPYTNILCGGARSIVFVQRHEPVGILFRGGCYGRFVIGVELGACCDRRNRKEGKEHSSDGVERPHC